MDLDLFRASLCFEGKYLEYFKEAILVFLTIIQVENLTKKFDSRITTQL